MKILKRIIYLLLIIPICTIGIIIEGPLLLITVLAIWVTTGSTTFRMKVNKGGGKSFYVYTITQIMYYSMDKYLTRLLEL